MKIERYVAKADYAAFSNNDPWHRVKAMRNVLIHEYFGVNLKIVWDTCHSNVPRLKAFVQNSLPKRP